MFRAYTVLQGTRSFHSMPAALRGVLFVATPLASSLPARSLTSPAPPHGCLRCRHLLLPAARSVAFVRAHTAAGMASSQPRVVLHSYWKSSCAWRVRIALNLLGIDYEYKVRGRRGFVSLG